MNARLNKGWRLGACLIAPCSVLTFGLQNSVYAQSDKPLPSRVLGRQDNKPATAGAARAFASKSHPVVSKLKTGDALLSKGEIREAALYYVQAALANPSDPLPRLAAGVSLAAIGRVKDAVPQLRKAAELAPDDVIVALLLREALTETGRGEEAQELYLDTVRRFARPGKPGLDSSVSIARLQAAVKTFPQSPVYRLLLGDAFQVSEQWAQADEAYKGAVLLAPLWVKPRVNLGISRLAQGKSDEAIRTFETALALEPNNIQVQLLKGDAQISAGQNGAAITTFSKVAQQRGGTTKTSAAAAQAMIGMGQALVNTRSYGKAIDSLTRAQKLAPLDPAPNALIGEIQAKAGDFDAASASYETALKLSRNGELFANQAVLYRALTEAQLSAQKPDQALATVRRALTAAPSEAALWHRLAAQAYYAKKDTLQGDTALKNALKTDQSLYPQDTLNAIAARGLVEAFRANFVEANDAAVTGFAGSATPGGGIVLTNKVKPATISEQAKTLEILAHIARYLNDTREEIRLREEVTKLRGTGRDWFLLGEAYDLRAREPANARASYGKAFQVGGVPEAIADWARNRLKALTAPLYKP